MRYVRRTRPFLLNETITINTNLQVNIYSYGCYVQSCFNVSRDNHCWNYCFNPNKTYVV